MLYRFKQRKKLRARGCLTRLLQILPWSHGVGKVPTQIIHGIGQTERKIEVKLSPFSSNWFNLRLLYLRNFSWIFIGHDVKVFEMIQTQVRVDYFLWSVTSQSFSQEESLVMMSWQISFAWNFPIGSLVRSCKKIAQLSNCFALAEFYIFVSSEN